jgi:O-antigen/teichoic acid export membrane protein
LPTVPHALAVPLLLTIGLAIVVRAEGLEVAGQLQIAALLGSSLVTVMNAINNAWVPLVFKASDPGRPRLLADSTFVVALAALVMICAYVVIAPLLVRFVAGVPLVDELVVCTSIVIATGVVFHVVYLANIHLTFLSGRTAPLALLTPLSAVIALLPLAFGGSISTGLVPIAFGLVWPIFYALQAVFSSLLAGRSGYPRVHFGWASIPLTLALVLALSVVLLSPNPAVVLAWTGIVLSLGTGATLLWLRNTPAAPH